jgi:hypothetical protein
MKKVMCITAIAMSQVGSANFAFAQTTPDLGANTGSESNRSEHTAPVAVGTRVTSRPSA